MNVPFTNVTTIENLLQKKLQNAIYLQVCTRDVCGIQCLSARLQQTEDLTETGRLFHN